jgi:hypothetical protein
MENIFINQDWTIILDVGIDISTAPTLEIVYRKPNSPTEVTVVAALYTSTSIYYAISAATNNADGQWLFRAKITDIAGKVLFGDVVRVDVRKAWHPYS